MSHLLAGVGRCDITPVPGTPQGGWGAQAHQRGLGADMPFYVTALALSDAATTVVLIDVDAIGFDSETVGKCLSAVAQLCGLPRQHIRFSYSHTHSGPNTFRLPLISEGQDLVLDYLGGLPLRIAGAAWQAMQDLKPVRFAAGSGQCAINVNRRLCLKDGRLVVGKNWDGPVDRTVRVLRFDDLQQKPLATIVHYACHPTTIAWQNQYFTPDYPGVVRQVVEQQLGGTCLFLQGACGNITPREGFTGDLTVYRRLGRLLGLEASRAALELETLPQTEKLTGIQESGAPIAIYESESLEPEDTVLRVLSKDISLPLKTFQRSDELEDKAAECRSRLSDLRKQGAPSGEIQAATAQATQIGMRLDSARLYGGRTHVSWPLQGIRIGPVALLAIPGEPFTETNQEIVSASPFPHTFFSGYSNGGFGYIPVRSACEEGGYEVDVSPFLAEASEIVTRECLALLRDLAK